MDILLAFFYIVLALLFLGVIVAFSPTLLITELTILTKSKQPLLHTVAFISGIALPVVIFSIFTIFIIEPNAQISVPTLEEKVGPTPLLDLLVGAMFAFAGIRILNSKPTKSSRFKPQKLLSSKTLFWFGALKMATSVTSIAAILYASRFLKTNTSESLQQLAGVLWLMAVSLLPFILIALAKWFSPDRFNRIQQYSDKISEFNWRFIISISMILLGIALIVSGIITIF